MIRHDPPRNGFPIRERQPVPGPEDAANWYILRLLCS
jgi:hypothetical protein